MEGDFRGHFTTKLGLLAGKHTGSPKPQGEKRQSYVKKIVKINK